MLVQLNLCKRVVDDAVFSCLLSTSHFSGEGHAPTAIPPQRRNRTSVAGSHSSSSTHIPVVCSALLPARAGICGHKVCSEARQRNVKDIAKHNYKVPAFFRAEPRASCTTNLRGDRRSARAGFWKTRGMHAAAALGRQLVGYVVVGALAHEGCGCGAVDSLNYARTQVAASARR